MPPRKSPIKHQVREHTRVIDGVLVTVRDYPRGSGERRKESRVVSRHGGRKMSTVTVMVDDNSYVFETESTHRALDLSFVKDDQPQQLIKKITMVGDFK